MEIKKQEESFKMNNKKDIVYPKPLEKGDKIALISPASAVKPEYVTGALEKIIDRGFEPVLMPSALGNVDGSFAAPKADRFIDLLDALENEEFRAILCTRGGYGCSQLLPNINFRMVKKNPKWLIGFSDISALLALWCRSGIASIHGPMAKHISTMPEDNPCTLALFNMLENGGRFDYKVSTHECNRKGKVEGVLRGGNLAVLNDLADTPVDILNVKFDEDIILFLEDINEPIYKVNRMLYRLINSGALYSVKGIIFGQFTDYKPDANFSSMEEMLHSLVDTNNIPDEIPIAYNFPVGHTDVNFPLTEGTNVELNVTDSFVSLRSLH